MPRVRILFDDPDGTNKDRDGLEHELKEAGFKGLSLARRMLSFMAMTVEINGDDVTFHDEQGHLLKIYAARHMTILVERAH